jgi:hypothetical protein
MRTYELYFNGPSKPNEKFPYAPTPEHMYADFIQTVHSSGYRLKNSSMKHDRKGFVIIEVIGEK